MIQFLHARKVEIELVAKISRISTHRDAAHHVVIVTLGRPRNQQTIGESVGSIRVVDIIGKRRKLLVMRDLIKDPITHGRWAIPLIKVAAYIQLQIESLRRRNVQVRPEIITLVVVVIIDLVILIDGRWLEVLHNAVLGKISHRNEILRPLRTA